MLEQFVRMILVNLVRAERPVQEDIIKEAYNRFSSTFSGFTQDEICQAVNDCLENPKSMAEAMRTARTKLPLTSVVTDDQIERALDQVMTDLDYAGLDRIQIKRELESIYSIRQEPFRKIEDAERREPWLDASKAGIDWEFWPRYREYLQDEKSYPPDTIKKLDDLTDDILDSLFNPNEKIEIDKKGLVVGQVQSGKHLIIQALFARQPMPASSLLLF